MQPKLARRSRSGYWSEHWRRGMNGQDSRSGGGVRLGFEGGQMPLYRRILRKDLQITFPSKEYTEVNVADLNRFERWNSHGAST